MGAARSPPAALRARGLDALQALRADATLALGCPRVASEAARRLTELVGAGAVLDADSRVVLQRAAARAGAVGQVALAAARGAAQAI